MSNPIRIFKFEKQEAYNLELIRNSTIEDRFRKLYMMQKISIKICGMWLVLDEIKNKK